MTAPPLDLAALRRIGVVRLLRGLGDLLCIVPALRSVRAGCPTAEIVFFGLPDARWMVERYPELIDRFVPVGHWDGIPEADGPQSMTDDALDLAHRLSLDLAVQLHGSGSHMNPFVAALQPRLAAGHCAGAAGPSPLFRPWPDRGHEIERFAGLVEWLGFPAVPRDLDFPELPGDRAEAAACVGQLGGDPYVVVHPGASRPDRRWAAAGFGRVADHLGARVAVLVTGNAAEADLAAEVGSICPTASVVAGATSLGAMSSLVRGAQAVVCNDTGVAHLAVATGTPACVVITTSDAARWAPIDRVVNRVVEVDIAPDEARLAADVARVCDAVDDMTSALR
jgi:ADP-heptose:LPS heptosyltransferase